MKDLTGRVFGRLTVQGFAGSDKSKCFWKCLCECGNVTINPIGNLTSGNTKSCGCLSRELSRLRHLSHGLTESREYIVWCHIKARCLNPRNAQFGYYGGRGILICDRWLHSFENFYADMGPRPSPKHSIDRYPNNDGNYEPGNCRWATHKDQCNNTSRNVRITHNNQTKNLTEWSETTGIKASTLYSRYHKGWTAPELFLPVLKDGTPAAKKLQSVDTKFL